MIFKESNLQWYTDLRSGLEKDITRRCRVDGTPIARCVVYLYNKEIMHLILSREGKYLGRTLLIRIGHALLAANNKESVDRRCIINCIFASCGRTGEVAYCKWSKAYWDYEERALFNQWVEAKTNRVTPMCYFQDASSFQMCVIHSFACYLLTIGIRFRVSNFDMTTFFQLSRST